MNKHIIYISTNTWLTIIATQEKYDPYEIYKYVKQAIKEDKENSFDTFSECFLHKIKHIVSLPKSTDGFYFTDIKYNDGNVSITTYKDYNKTIECFHKTYVTETAVKGNCVDDFIARCVKPLLEDMRGMASDIEGRQNDRSEKTDYHSSACYEKDFYQISSLRNISEKLAENCNRFLTQISEKYTKL